MNLLIALLNLAKWYHAMKAETLVTSSIYTILVIYVLAIDE